MPLDQAPQFQTANGPNWEIPEITNVKVKSSKYQPRAARNFQTPIDAVPDAVEIVVSLKEPLPIRAMSPVLWVGGEQLTESEAVDKGGKKVRFWSFSRAKLASGAPITMSWMNEPPAKTQSGVRPRFTYKPPK